MIIGAIVGNIIKEFQVLLSLGYFLMMIYLLIVLCGTSYHIVSTIHWAFSRPNDSASIRKVGRKSIWLLVVSIALALLVIINIIFVTLSDSLNRSVFNKFAIDVMSSFLTLVILGSLLVFLENYLLQYGFFKGYSLAYDGKISARSLSRTKTATTSLSKPSPRSEIGIEAGTESCSTTSVQKDAFVSKKPDPV